MGSITKHIVELLDSASGVHKKFCARCSCQMVYGNSAVFYRGKQWQVRLPVCPRCSPERNRDDA